MTHGKKEGNIIRKLAESLGVRRQKKRDRENYENEIFREIIQKKKTSQN